MKDRQKLRTMEGIFGRIVWIRYQKRKLCTDMPALRLGGLVREFQVDGCILSLVVTVREHQYFPDKL